MANQIYIGSFETTSQYTPPNFGLKLQIDAASLIPTPNNQKDQLTATVTLFGTPIQGVTVNFTSNSPAYQVSPRYASTNSSGQALSYIWGSKPGAVKLFASFSNTVSTYLILSFGGSNPIPIWSLTPAMGASTPDGSEALAVTGSAAPLYICVGALNGFYGTEGDSIGSTFTARRGTDVTGVGDQINDGCGAWSTDGNGDDSAVAAALGVKGFASYQFYGTSSGAAKTETDLNGVTVTSTDQLVVVAVACGYDNCDQGGQEYIQFPPAWTCVNQITQDYGAVETAAIYACYPSAAGTYTVSAFSGDGQGAEMAIGAYVFTPQVQQISTTSSTSSSTSTSSSSSTTSTTSTILYPQVGLTARPSTPTTLDLGQSIPANSVATQGTLPYTYSWTVASGASCPSATSGSGNTNTLIYTPTAQTTTCAFTFTVYDPYTSNTATTAAIMVNPALGTATLSPTTATYDTGQTITLTSSISGGSAPYAYRWYNATTGANILMSGKTASSLIETAGSTAQTVKYYVSISDSGTTNEVANSVIKSYAINTALLAGVPTETNTIITSGQSSTLTAHPSGGTPSYTINWFNQGGCGGPSQGTGTTLSVSPASTTTYSYNVVDSATSANVACSASNSITVHAALLANTLTESNTLIDNGQYSTLSAGATGGTPPYTFHWFNRATCTGASQGTGTTLSVHPASTATYVYNVVDSATPAGVVCAPSNSITVNSALGAATISATPPYTVYGTLTVTSQISGGSTPYAYQWYNATTGANVLMSGKTASSLSVATGSTGHTVKYFVSISDSATTSETANSPTGTYTITGTTTTFVAKSLPAGATFDIVYDSITNTIVMPTATNSVTFFTPSGTYADLIPNTIYNGRTYYVNAKTGTFQAGLTITVTYSSVAGSYP